MHMETTLFEPEWLTVREAGDILDLNTSALSRRIRRGDLPAQRIPHSRGGMGYSYLLKHADVIAFRDRGMPRHIPEYKHSPSVADCAYLAGFIDGEGTIIIRRNRRSYTISVSVVNTYEPVLNWIVDTFGSTKCRVKRYQRPDRHVPIYVWNACAFHAYHILELTSPYLRVKHEQARLALDFQKAMTGRFRNRWSPVTDEELQWREEQRLRISALNRSRYLPSS